MVLVVTFCDRDGDWLIWRERNLYGKRQCRIIEQLGRPNGSTALHDFHLRQRSGVETVESLHPETCLQRPVRRVCGGVVDRHRVLGASRVEQDAKHRSAGASGTARAGTDRPAPVRLEPGFERPLLPVLDPRVRRERLIAAPD